MKPYIIYILLATIYFWWVYEIFTLFFALTLNTFIDWRIILIITIITTILILTKTFKNQTRQIFLKFLKESLKGIWLASLLMIIAVLALISTGLHQVVVSFIVMWIWTILMVKFIIIYPLLKIKPNLKFDIWKIIWINILARIILYSIIIVFIDKISERQRIWIVILSIILFPFIYWLTIIFAMKPRK